MFKHIKGVVMTYHSISLPILSEITGISQPKLEREYAQVIEDNCVPLACVEQEVQDTFVQEYLYRDTIIDFPFLACLKQDCVPIQSKEVQQIFTDTKLIKEALLIQHIYSANSTVTKQLLELCKQYSISYSTLARRRKQFMHSTPLTRILQHNATTTAEADTYRTCCLYCKDLIIFLHEKPGKISASKIFRDITKMKPFPCSSCPYYTKTCQRNTQEMIKPKHVDVVRTIIRRIPEQQDVFAWYGVRKWANIYHFTPERKKPNKVNEVWFSDHKQFDIFVRVNMNGKWIVKRPWITAIIDAASSVMVSYVLSLQPNSDCIAECFARACAFTVDTPYCGIPDYFYIDNGKDYRSKKIQGLVNNDQPLFFNKDFSASGILEWFGIKVIHALPYKGCSKSIESIWGTIDDEWIRELPGYCGCNAMDRNPRLEKDIEDNKLYTFEQFADYFAETIYPAYNDFSVTKPSPNKLYAELEKTSSFVPTWATLAVLKSIHCKRVIRSKGIQYNNAYYWCSALGPLIEKDKNTQYTIYAFDTPFNRTISVVDENHNYIGEAHLIEKSNVVEKNRYKVMQHIQEQQKQRKFYSTKLQQLHNIIYATNILDEVCHVPPIDDIRYTQKIDAEKNKELKLDTTIPQQLQQQATTNNLVVEETQEGNLTKYMKLLAKQSREK